MARRFTLSNGTDAYLTFVQVAEKHAGRPYHRSGVGLNHLAFRLPDRAAVDGLRAWCRKKKRNRPIGTACLITA